MNRYQASKDTIPHSRDNPPAPNHSDATGKGNFKFVIAHPKRERKIPTAMAKRPVEKK